MIFKPYLEECESFLTQAIPMIHHLVAVYLIRDWAIENEWEVTHDFGPLIPENIPLPPSRPPSPMECDYTILSEPPTPDFQPSTPTLDGELESEQIHLLPSPPGSAIKSDEEAIGDEAFEGIEDEEEEEEEWKWVPWEEVHGEFHQKGHIHVMGRFKGLIDGVAAWGTKHGMRLSADINGPISA
jgi:hypothetical protein